ncbi:MAG: lysophospholipid acyltransferase family protein [Polyangiales bacterium]
MTIDDFEPAEKVAFRGLRPADAQQFFERVDWLAHHLAIETLGLEHIPEGRALMVANHSFGWDVVFPMARIARALHRQVWVLGEHLWWKVPYLRRWAAAVGVVDGSPENVDRLLANDELVLVLPGGLREAVKPRELRYKLLWGQRYGFVRAALRNRAPLLPLAAVGTDEVFDFMGNAFTRGTRWLNPLGLPLPVPSRLVPFPHRMIRARFLLGEPVVPNEGPEAASDELVVRRLRREVEGGLHELIEAELARRAGIDLS